MNTTIRTRVRRVWMLACLLQAAMGLTAALGGAASVAAPAGEPAPVAAYVSPPDFAQVTISPDGRYLAALSPLKGKRNLVVLDLQTMKSRAVTAIATHDVVSYRWVGSEFLVFEQGRLDTPTGVERAQGVGPSAVRRDGTGFRRLADLHRSATVLRVVPGSNTDVIVSASLRTRRPDLYRLNLDTGERTLLTPDKPAFVVDWLLDNEALPRGAVVVDKEDAPEQELVRTVLVRESLEKPWQEMGRFTFQQPGAWSPRAFAPDNRNLIVEARRGKDTSGLHLFDVQTKSIVDLIYANPRYDASETTLQRDPLTGRVVGFSINDERHQQFNLDADGAAVQAAMEAQFKGRAVATQRSGGGMTLVTVWSDRHPATYFLFDEKAKALKPLLRSRRDLDERNLVEMRPFLLKTRDGLEIPSYYFLPPDYQSGQKLPTVVHIHGGPHVRADTWGTLSGSGVREAQVLASRGYAVVLPNFRITPGLGHRVYNAGWGEIGRKMSDDHEDAARWAVAQGFADPQRMCISGSSYGGYATLWASIRSAELFKCGIAGLVVSDRKRQMTSMQTDYASSDSAVAFWKRIVGMEGDNWSRADETSPALHAERSNFPLFIWAGAADRRTPLEQTEMMVSALKKAGKPPEIVMVKSDEGHGFGLQENRIDLYETMLKFLDKHIGRGPSQP